MNKTITMISVLLAAILFSTGPVLAQDEAQPAEDISWLAAIAKPAIEFESMTVSWSADSSAVIFENVIVDWRDSTDASFTDHTIRKALNCLPEGTLKISNGDSVVVHPMSARIEQIIRDGTFGSYRMVLPIQDASGKPLAERPKGRVTITLSAGKVVDRKYSVEMTRQTAVEL